MWIFCPRVFIEMCTFEPMAAPLQPNVTYQCAGSGFFCRRWQKCILPHTPTHSVSFRCHAKPPFPSHVEHASLYGTYFPSSRRRTFIIRLRLCRIHGKCAHNLLPQPIPVRALRVTISGWLMRVGVCVCVFEGVGGIIQILRKPENKSTRGEIP